MGILDFVFPKTCLDCGKEGKYLCPNCIAKVPLAGSICPYCKHPSIDGVTHVNCRKKFGIDGLISIWEYEGVVRKGILSLKYKYATEIGNELSGHLIDSLRAKVMPAVQYLTPIPVYWYRQNTRGFNQSLEVGRKVAELMNWKFIPDLLVKNKPTVSQVELSGEKRRKNLTGVFVVNTIFRSTLSDFRSVVIFDDVFTTGSTMTEAAKVLKRGGVEKVWGLTIAR
jgi:ComF family protein